MEPSTVPPAREPLVVDSPAEILALIDAREREIERTLHEAREAAAAIVREARERAERIAAARREQAVREGEEQGARIVAEAQRGAARILAAGLQEAAAIRATPAERIARAVERLLAVVLPAVPAGDDRK